MPRFVLLEHTLETVHWDFLIEAGGVLRSWAIDEPVVPGRDLPARPLPDHRTIYLDYEGEISRGRGRVRRVDAGEYELVADEGSRVVVRIAGAQLVGEVEVRQLDVESEGGGMWNFRLGKVD